MGLQQAEFEQFLKEELEKYSNAAVPVESGRLERAIIKKVDISKVHPNPMDEFCSPKVGPHYGIINKYVSKFERHGKMIVELSDEPLIVVKIHNGEYMLLNGHHRWAAARSIGFKTVPVSIVNLPQETDVKKMVDRSTHDKRVTLDLDETILCKNGEPAAPAPGFFGKRYKERICKGVPALLHYFSNKGYDIWIYTAEFYSIDYVRKYFKKYSVKVDGIITGTARNVAGSAETKKYTEKLLASKYNETFHIDRDLIVRSFKNSDKFEEYEVTPGDDSWALKMLEIVKGLDKNAD